MGNLISVKEVSDFRTKLMEALSGKGIAADLSRVEDDDRETGNVTFLFGKYGYSVDERHQDEDYSILHEVVEELQSHLPEGLKVSAEWSDKYNEVNLTRD